MESVGGLNLGKRKNLEKISKHFDTAHYNEFLETPRFELGTPVGTDEPAKRSKFLFHTYLKRKERAI